MEETGIEVIQHPDHQDMILILVNDFFKPNMPEMDLKPIISEWFRYKQTRCRVNLQFESKGKFICPFLTVKNEDRPIRLKWRFYFAKKDKTFGNSGLLNYNFHSNSYAYCGVRKFLSKEELFFDCLLENNLVMVLSFDEGEIASKTNEQLFLFANSVSNIYSSETFPRLLNEHRRNTELNDFQIKFKTRSIVCEIEILHALNVPKYLLMLHSPYFKAMFTTGLNNNFIVIDEFCDDIVRRMVDFLFTCQFKVNNNQQAIDLFKIAHKYEIIELKSQAERYLLRYTNLASDIDLNLVCDLAIEYELDLLKFKLLSFVKELLIEPENKNDKKLQLITSKLGYELVIFLAKNTIENAEGKISPKKQRVN